MDYTEWREESIKVEMAPHYDSEMYPRSHKLRFKREAWISNEIWCAD